ncbi:MAG: sugar MFS transporter [Bacteroidia bacterium]|jgi:FHS family L-fucose permease-like MFS transporter|nr:sugar MFS transporter [Bacteroidia bacterium]
MPLITARQNKGTSYVFAFAVMTALFFLWGFVTVMNDILMPHLKDAFKLSNTESALVQFAFFIAYGVVSLIYYLWSVTYGDPISKIGYRPGMVIALGICSMGCVLFYAAAEMETYGWFLAALFVLASGITLLQITANPYVALLGKPEGASGRLNLSQGFNSLGTALAPLLGGAIVFGTGKVEVDVLKLPYLLLALSFIAAATILGIMKLPEVQSGSMSRDAFRYPQLRLGMIAIFAYVGAEVTIGSFAIRFMGLPEVAGLPKHEADAFLVYYWGGAMTGRFLGTLALSQFSSAINRVLAMLGTAILLTAFLLLLTGKNVQEAWPYFILLLINMLGFIAGRGNASRLLLLFALIAAVLIAVASLGAGNIALWALLAAGLFNSVMWSNIFTLGIRDLGPSTSQGSSLLVMMIIGGALWPLLAGGLADGSFGLQKCLLIVIPCYLYIAFYGWFTGRMKWADTSVTHTKPGH